MISTTSEDSFDFDINHHAFCQEIFTNDFKKLFLFRKRLHKKIVEGIVRNSSTLKALRFDHLEMPRKYFDPVMTSCVNLTELWLVNVNQPQKSVEKICNNMPSSLQRLIIQHVIMTNVAIENIVTRCPNLVELELYELCPEPMLPNGGDDPEVVDKMIIQISGMVVSNLLTVVEFHSVADEIQ